MVANAFKREGVLANTLDQSLGWANEHPQNPPVLVQKMWCFWGECLVKLLYVVE